MSDLLASRGLTKVAVCYLDRYGRLQVRAAVIAQESVAGLLRQLDELEAGHPEQASAGLPGHPVH